MKKHTVTIKVDANGNPSAHPPRLNASVLDEIEWVSDKGEDFVVYFEDSPFRSSFFHRNQRTGLPAVASGDKAYKYSVSVQGKVCDPDIIIDEPK